MTCKSVLSSMIILGGLVALAGCAGKSQTQNDYTEIPVETLYNHAMNDLADRNWTDAAKDFAEVDRQHPTSVWATKAQLMQAYSLYQADKLPDAVAQLDRFIQLHPGNKDVAYAYYLKAICYYEQISDVERDQEAARRAQTALQAVIDRFPTSAYARDATFRLTTVRDHLAGREMEIGRFYETRKEYLAAIDRYKGVLETYQTTSQVPEALYRLVECYEALGLTDEAARDAAVLGYNYPGSQWYADAYRMMERLSPGVVARYSAPPARGGLPATPASTGPQPAPHSALPPVSAPEAAPSQPAPAEASVPAPAPSPAIAPAAPPAPAGQTASAGTASKPAGTDQGGGVGEAWDSMLNWFHKMY